jgi:ketosteroid isomerase-like protein
MAKRDIKTLQGGYDAFAKGDIDAVLAIMDARIQWYEPDVLPWGGRTQGPKNVAGNVFAVVSTIANFKVKPDGFVTDGDTVVVTGAFSGKGKNGDNFKAPFAHIWKMRDGKAVRFQNYTDTETINSALGAKRRGVPRMGVPRMGVPRMGVPRMGVPRMG